MSGEKVINALLKADAATTALVGARIYPVPLPQGTQLPAIGYRSVSNVPERPIDITDAYRLRTQRIEITAYADDYPTQKQLLQTIRAACNLKSGSLGGVTVVACLWDSDGPDFRDDDVEIYSQSCDFFVTYRE